MLEALVQRFDNPLFPGYRARLEEKVRARLSSTIESSDATTERLANVERMMRWAAEDAERARITAERLIRYENNRK